MLLDHAIDHALRDAAHRHIAIAVDDLVLERPVVIARLRHAVLALLGAGVDGGAAGYGGGRGRRRFADGLDGRGVRGLGDDGREALGTSAAAVDG